MQENTDVYQAKFWRELDQLKVHALYLSVYLQKTVDIDRNINIFLAIMSSSSICGWAIWKEFSFLWGFLIAASQLVNAVKIYLPYKKRLACLQGISSEMENLFLSMETQWFDVSEGRLAAEEINNLHMRIKKKKLAITEEYFRNNPLPHNEKFMEQAKSLALQYFNQFYPAE